MPPRNDVVRKLRAANRHLGKSDREAAGVLSAAQRHTHFLDSPRMVAVLDRSDFGFADLKRRNVSVFLVLPPDRHIGAVDTAREQRDPLVVRGRAGHRHEIERAEIARPHQLGLDGGAVIGGIGAEPFRFAVVVHEPDEPQILQPLRLRLGAGL
ncbi:MAG: type IV secretory system conjugative DNA transfer family protein, partial [Rhizobiales bacterium]|nr:type IV secretory system conjugative DNA transfer family protein [Hyphomicrobiales bacterium]